METGKFWGFIKKYSIMLCVVVVLLVSASVSYAAYTRVNVVKRVVSTGEGLGYMFASDYMSSTVNMTTRKTFSDRNTPPTVSVSVFNYPYPQKSAYRRDDTEYTMTAKLKKQSAGNTFVDLSNEEIAALSSLDYQIIYKATTFSFGTGGSVENTFNCTIDGGDFNQDLFTLKFDRSELSETPNGYCMELVATPKDNELPVLRGYVMVRYTQTASGGWSGRLEPLEAEKEYDAYNYIVEGTGAGKLTIQWNPNKVRINKWFLQNSENTFYKGTNIEGGSSVTESAVTTDDGEMRKLTLVVDGQTRNRYEIQFYKVGSDEVDYENGDIPDYLPDTDVTAWVADSQ